MIRIYSSLKEIMQVENPAFYLYMFKLISTPNRMIMKQLVHNGYISCNQLLFEIMELFHQMYESPIECSIFCHVLNSYLALYLQRVIRKYDGLTPSISISDSWVLMRPYDYLNKMPIKVEHNSVLPVRNVSSNNSTRGLLNSNLHIFGKRDHLKEDFSLSRKIPIVDSKNDCDVSFLSAKKNNVNVSDLQSFLLPLQQDYTKSSKGYSSQNKCNKNALENTVNLSSNNNLQNKEPVDDSDFNISDDDDEYYDPAQNLIISRYLNSLNISSSESEVDYSEICWDSDSDDSIVFSENVAEDTQETAFFDKCRASTSEKIELNLSFSYHSDSDDSEFVEMFGSKCEQTSKGYKYTYESNDSATYNGNLLESFDDNISFSLHQKFDSSLKNDFSDSPFSLSQSKLTVFSADFEGFTNPCFEDDNVLSEDNLKNINDKWETSMQAISCEPRQPKRVSFVPLPDLVSVQIFEPDDDNYRYSIALLDQIRFRNRIEEFEEVIKPYLSPGHRAKVYQSYNSSNVNS